MWKRWSLEGVLLSEHGGEGEGEGETDPTIKYSYSTDMK